MKLFKVFVAVAIVCLLVFAMVSCGDETTPADQSGNNQNNTTPSTQQTSSEYVVTLDPGDGVLDEDELEIIVDAGKRIGTLPKPELEGYSFDGWYEEDDEDFETKIKSSTLVNSDMTLVAHYIKYPVVTFNAGNGTVEEEQRAVESGKTIGTLPVATPQEGFLFNGWYEEDDAAHATKITSTFKVSGDMTLVAYYVTDPNYKNCELGVHSWGRWQYTEADCTNPAKKERECTECGEKETDQQYSIDNPALGHDFADWQSAVMGQSRTCKVCGEKETNSYKNISSKGAIYSVTTSNGQWGDWGILNDGNWKNDPSVCAKGGSVEIHITLKTAQHLEQIAICGGGTAAYTIYVLYDGASDFEQFASGTTGNGSGKDNASTFDFDNDGKLVSEIKINQPNSSYGTDYWYEIALGVKE